MKGTPGGQQPTTAEDIKANLPEKYTLDSKAGEFLRYSEFLDPLQTKLMLVYISDVGRHILQNAEVLFCDGTYNTAPDPFKQIYFVLGRIKGKRPIICAYGLLPDKEFITYEKFVEVLKSILDLETLKLERVMTDFKPNVWKAFFGEFLEIDYVGCLFHFLKAITRYLQSLHLTSLYGNEADFQYLVKLVHALAYVPPDRVLLAYNTIIMVKLEAIKKCDYWRLHGENILKFMLYVRRTWVGREHSSSYRSGLYAIKCWNKHEDVLAGRKLTNNTVECYNSTWTDTLERRPALYSVIEGFIRKVNFVMKKKIISCYL